MAVSEEDKKFIETLLNELDSDMLDILEEKLRDSEFKLAYDQALSEKYDNKKGKILGYTPMITLILLLIIGIILVMKTI